jgi:hypothetical protein
MLSCGENIIHVPKKLQIPVDRFLGRKQVQLKLACIQAGAGGL